MVCCEYRNNDFANLFSLKSNFACCFRIESIRTFNKTGHIVYFITDIRSRNNDFAFPLYCYRHKIKKTSIYYEGEHIPAANSGAFWSTFFFFKKKPQTKPNRQ
jgi:hypothetical protein